MWKDYVLEREGVQVLELDKGFLLLKEVADMLYIQDIYVKPEFRQQGEGRNMLQIVEDVAAERGIKKILGSCDPKATGSTTSMKAMFACGFNLYSCENNLVYLIKEL